MPTITYKGPRRAGANCGRLGWWIWGEARVVTTEWLEENRSQIDGPEFVIEGHTFAQPEVTVDEGNDGIPDMKWTKGDILGWMEEKGIEASSLSTKKTLLAKVEEFLNPPEETITEAEEADTTGVE